MNCCLWCDENIIMQINWESVIHLRQRPLLCEDCINQLEKLSGNKCRTCSKQTTERQCDDCKKWTNIYTNNDPLKKNVSLYTYNDYMKEMIAKWKYRGDYILSEVFKDAFRSYFNEEFAEVKNETIIIPIPLSKERLFERGFNQANVLASFISDHMEQLLERVHSEKQSKKSRIERMTSANPFRLTKAVQKPVILIDDIYTTGRTIRHAAALLKSNGCPAVYAYTLIRG